MTLAQHPEPSTQIHAYCPSGQYIDKRYLRLVLFFFVGGIGQGLDDTDCSEGSCAGKAGSSGPRLATLEEWFWRELHKSKRIMSCCAFEERALCLQGLPYCVTVHRAVYASPKIHRGGQMGIPKSLKWHIKTKSYNFLYCCSKSVSRKQSERLKQMPTDILWFVVLYVMLLIS